MKTLHFKKSDAFTSNGSSDTPNIVRIYADAGSGREPRIWFGGAAQTVIDGPYHPPIQR